MSKKLTNIMVDERLAGRNVLRLDNYIDNSTKIRWKCLLADCGYTWLVSPNNVLNNSSGCPKCGGSLQLTNKIIDDKLEGKNIRRVGNIINNRSKLDWECLADGCQYVWLDTLNNVLRTKFSCPRCAGFAKLTNEIVDERLAERDIKRIGDITNNKTKTHFMCIIEECSHVWLSRPDSILNGRGCPNCKNGKNERLVYNILKEYEIIFEKHKPISKIINNENRRIIVDFYIKNINSVIEYNGEQHYKPVKFGGISKEAADVNFVKQKERDQYLQTFCDSNGIKLIWIDGRKFIGLKLKNYLINDLIPLLKL